MPKPKCPTRFTLVQWQCEDIQADAAKFVSRHVDSCPDCQAVLSDLKNNLEHFEPRREAHLAHVLEECRTSDQYSPENKWSVAGVLSSLFRPRTLIPALGVAMAIAIGLYLPWSEIESSKKADDIVFKGSVGFSITAQRKDAQFPVTDRSVLHEGDRLKMDVTVAEPSYIAIFSVEQNKKISVFYPEPPSADPLQLKTAGRHSLPGSIVLDDAQGVEWIILIVSPESFDVDKEARALQRIDEAVTRASLFRALKERHVNFHVVTIEKQ